MPDEHAGEYAIDVDPSLIEAALASVDKAARKPRRSRKAAPVLPPEEMVFDPGDLGEPPPAEMTEEELFDAGELAEAAQVTPPPNDLSVDAPGDDSLPALAEIEVEVAPAVAEGEVEQLRLQLRVREQAETIRLLEARLARATEISDGLDKQVRELRTHARKLEADADLVRQRHRREREEAERRAEEHAARGLIEVVDNVERAVAFAESDPNKLTTGLQIIREQFRSLLRKLQIDRISADVGTPFDPAMHEAVLHQPTTEGAEGSILSEVSAGFRLRGRLLRPARVVVAAPPPPTTDG